MKAHASAAQTGTLVGKSALVTGAARRVGAAIASHLHAAGANVVVHHHRSDEAARQLTDRLNAVRPGSAASFPANLLETATAELLTAHAVERFGALDVLVNNASTFYPTPIGTVTEAVWDDLIGTNLKAPFFLSQAAAPFLKASRGLIVNLVDIHAQRPLPDYAVYCAAKAGLVMLTRALARELGPEVRVNGIAPGPILWPENGMDTALQAKIIGRTALKRAGSPDDIARAVLFFATQAPYVTGQILAVDGGRSVGW